MVGGLTEVNRKGTPQGGPLSPLLSNIVLDDLDKELERRGHKFCRYADDCNVYVGSKKAGERVMGSLIRFLEDRLKLRVNQAKSAVARPWKRVFLGYSVTVHKESRMKVASQAVKWFKNNVKERIRQGRGRNMGRFIREDLNPLLQGWVHYFRLAEVRGVFEELDGWIRRKLRCIVWRQWKRSRTRYRKLLGRNIEEERSRLSSFNGRGAWWNSGASHMNEAFPKKYFDQCGLVCLLDELLRLQAVS
jgi:RNA-directed DNA polymerase